MTAVCESGPGPISSLSRTSRQMARWVRFPLTLSGSAAVTLGGRAAVARAAAAAASASFLACLYLFFINTPALYILPASAIDTV